MSLSEWPDLAALASLAKPGEADLLRKVLRAQTDLFAAAPRLDRTALEAFAALATGLILKTDDETAVYVATKLALFAETPQVVRDCLIARGGEAARIIQGRIFPPVEAQPRMPAELPATAEPSQPETILEERIALEDLPEDDATLLEIARDRHRVLTGSLLDHIVARGRQHSAIAQALLQRDDLSPLDCAALYLHAPMHQRGILRGRLKRFLKLTGRSQVPPRADAASRERLQAFAEKSDLPGFSLALAEALGLALAFSWRFQFRQHQEVLALSLLAIGMPEEDALSIFLTLDAGLARSVPTVYNMISVIRTTSRPAAVALLEEMSGSRLSPRAPVKHIPAMEPGGTPARAGIAAVSERRVRTDRARRAT